MSKRKYPRKNSSGWRKEIISKCGTVCKACGSTENIEYHHIVPLWMGGSDDVSNIMALCHSCHVKIHGKMPSCEKGNGGRPSVSSTKENASEIFEMYINGEIGNRKAVELLGYAQSAHVSQMVGFKKYIKSKGIIRVHNDIDLVGVTAKCELRDGEIVGVIVLNSGEEIPMTFKDTGANDVEYKKRQLLTKVQLEKEIEEDNDEMCDQEYDQIFDMYINGRIGNKELKKSIGLPQKASINDFTPFQGYMKRNGIIEIINDVDGRMRNSNGNLPDGSIVARISWSNGEETFVKYNHLDDEQKTEQ